jgi:hypothetical protein
MSAVSSLILYTPASSGLSIPTRRFGFAITGRAFTALSRNSGPSLQAQPAPRTIVVSFIFFSILCDLH